MTTTPTGSARATRRTILQISFVTVLAAVIVKICGLIAAFLRPPLAENSYGGLVDAGFLKELPEIGEAPLHFPEGRFWLVHEEDGLIALHSSCSHLDCLFSWDEGKKLFVCPCHGSEFDTRGAALSGPAEKPLKRFPIRLRQGDELLPLQAEELWGEPLAINAYLAKKENRQDETTRPTPITVLVDTGKQVKAKG